MNVELLPVVILRLRGGSFICDSLDLDEPASCEEALASPASHEWIVAMRDEMDSLAKNQV